MSSQTPTSKQMNVIVENIGGIDRTDVALRGGVSVLTGRNATNRTSFLNAIMAALGSETPSLKADADRGSVELSIGDASYTRTLQRVNGSVAFDGEPYLDDPELADLFAFLLENNEARRAVERGDDLREVIMRPIDTDAIDRRIAELESEKRELDDEIDRLANLESDLPELESEKRSIEDELAEKRQQLASIEDRLEGIDADPEESRNRKEELESVFADLRDARSDVEDVEFDLETERTTVAELEAELEELESALEAGASDANPDRIEGRIEELRARKRSLDETVNELQSVIGFNEEMLEGDGRIVDEVLDSTDADGAPTDELLGGDTTACWTCGSDVTTDRIEGMLDRLRKLRKEKLSERNGIREEIADLTSERDEIRDRRRERDRRTRRVERVEDQLESSRERIERLEAEREELVERVAELDAKTESFEETDYSEVLELHREANRLEIGIERLEGDLEDVTSTMESRRTAIDDREELNERREEVQKDLTELRTRVDRIEETAVESFNEHIETILDILEYGNIERIWIERRERDVREGRRKVQQSTFDLHVVRSTDGTAYQDTVDNLSESEREVTGLVFALAGYFVHDVHETVPFILLDSLEAIDSDRIAALVEYFERFADHLVVALLEEDAEGLPTDYAYVQDI